ncbi:MAG: rubredoxin-like domain-containing protein, partial [Bacteroidota bacterium]
RKCGHVHESKKALKNCPVCGHPEAYFELEKTNY